MRSLESPELESTEIGIRCKCGVYEAAKQKATNRGVTSTQAKSQKTDRESKLAHETVPPAPDWANTRKEHFRKKL